MARWRSTHPAAPEGELVLPGGEVELVEVVLEDELAGGGRLAVVVGGDTELAGDGRSGRRAQQQHRQHRSGEDSPPKPGSNGMCGDTVTGGPRAGTLRAMPPPPGLYVTCLPPLNGRLVTFLQL